MTTPDRIAVLEAAIARQQRELADARAEIARLKHEDELLTRRAWLRRAALAGGALVAADAMTAGPAAATDGAAILAGGQTTAESSTVLFADGTSYSHGLLAVTDTAFASIPVSFPTSAGALVYAGKNSSGSAGVATFGPTFGVYAQSDGALGVGVLGKAAVGVKGAGAGIGVQGMASDDNGKGVEGTVDGFSAIGVHGTSSAASATGVRGDAPGTDGFGVVGTGGEQGVHGEGQIGLYGVGTELGIYGECDATDGIAVEGQANSGTGVFGAGVTGVEAVGTTYGLHALADTAGIPIRANITKSTNPHSVIYASTPGTGTAVVGTSTGGRGGSFGGSAAAFQARASSGATHPSSGQVGDFYVDASHRLWFCKGGTNWKQLA